MKKMLNSKFSTSVNKTKSTTSAKNPSETETFFSVLGIKSIDSVVSFTSGKYVAISKVAPINGDLLDEKSLEMVANSIQSAISSFDGRIQILIQSEHLDMSSILDNIAAHKNTLNDELKIELLQEEEAHLKTLQDKVRNVLNFYIVLESVAKTKIVAEQILDDAFLSIKNELDAVEMYLDRLEQPDILKLFYERFNPDSSQSEPIQPNWTINDIAPEVVKIDKDGRYIHVENYIYRHFAITKYPQSVDNYRWLRKILDFKGNINISILLTPKNKLKITKQLSNAYNELKTKAFDAKKEDQRLFYQDQADSAQQMIRTISSDNVALYDTAVVISVFEKEKEALERQVNNLRAKVSGSYLQSTELSFRQLDAYLCTLPLLVENAISTKYVWNLSTPDIASIIPFDSSELMEDKGSRIGENHKSRGLIYLDFYNRKYNNPHLAIIADSGSGKSFWLNSHIIRQLPYRDYIIQFDIDGTAKFPWTEKIRFDGRSGYVINPFHIRNAIDSNTNTEDVGSYLNVKIMDLIVFFRWILKSMNEFDEALLEEDIRHTYERFGLTRESKSLPSIMPTLSDLASVMQSKIEKADSTIKEKDARTNMYSALKPYIVGSYAALFNGQTNWDYTFHTIFDVSQLSKIVQNPLYDLLLKDVWQFCKMHGTLDRMNPKITKMVVIDEVHVLADESNPQTLIFIAQELIKQSRKFGISVVTATQNISDLTVIKKFGTAIIDNSYFKIFFRLGENDHEIARTLYNLSAEEMRIVSGSGSSRTGAKGRGVFRTGSQSVLFQSRASRYELEIIDPVQFEEVYKTPSRFK